LPAIEASFRKPYTSERKIPLLAMVLCMNFGEMTVGDSSFSVNPLINRVEWSRVRRWIR
jgi:hypothetical protein